MPSFAEAEIKEVDIAIGEGWIPAKYPPVGTHKVHILYEDGTEDCAYCFVDGKLFAWDPNKQIPVTYYKIIKP